jgi:hypothetical protein
MGRREVKGSTGLEVGGEKKGKEGHRRKLRAPKIQQAAPGFGLVEPPFLARMLNIFMKIQLMFQVTKIYHFVSP